MATATLTATAQQYVFMYGGTNIFSNNSGTAANATTFSYANCVWTRSGNQFSNDGTYIRLGGNLLGGDARDLTLSGNTLTYGNYYLICYNGNWMRYNNSSQYQDVAYVLSEQSSASLTTPTVTAGQTTFADLGSYTYGHGTSSYRPILYKFTPNSGTGTAYYAIDGGAPTTSAAAPARTTTGINYTWILANGSTDDGHVRINSTTGEVTYYNTYATNTTTAIKVRATHTASGLSATSANYSITFNALPIVNPTSITATARTIEVGDSWDVDNYELGSAAGTQAYDYITAESSNPAVATVTNTNGKATISGVAEGTVTITLNAYASDNTTLACSTTFTLKVELIETGVSGTTVTLDDREDHNWSYYQAAGDLPTGYPTTYLSSPDPRNVKITYRGGSVSGASTVAISALTGENQNTMVYYKTLEKSVPGMTGNYPYTVISNPFSKRPKNGSTYYGFAGWKVVSGGEYIAEYNDNVVLPLDATIHFTNLDNNYTANCTSGEVVFEATWTAATVQTGSSAPTFYGGTYETNFWVLSGNSDIGNITVPANVTVSARNPDGTVNFTRNLTGTITAGGNNAKVEWVNMNSTGNVSAANYTFTMGRGIVNSGNGGDLRGESRNANCIQTVKIESGKYASLHNFNTGLDAARTCDQLMILGCDYDRAKGDNSKLEITTTMYVADRQSLNRTSGSLYVRTYIKSGEFLTGQQVNDASAAYTYYFSVANTQNKGRRHLEIEGGILKSVAGGIDDGNNANDLAFTFRMRGGKLLGSIYGAAAFAETDGIRRMIFTGGEVNGWIAGGANGVNTTQTLNTNSGVLPANTYIYVGGKTKVESTSNTNINSSPGGYVFGAGVGRQALVNAGNAGGNTGRVNISYVSVSDQCEIEHDVFAGGNFGYNNVGGNVFVTGGTVHGSVFGGANQNRGVNSNIIMTGGLVESGIYGGSNVTGSLSGNVTMHIDGGQVGTSSQSANIHGGGYGSVTRVLGTVDLTLGSGCDATNGVTVYGDVYGGSAEGRTNGDNYRNGNATTTVNMYKGTINGSLYGGGLGTASNAAHVYGPVQVNVIGGSIRPTDGTGENGSGGVYGCNNANGAPQSTVKVDIYGTDEPASGYALYAVYGGGNQSDYDGVPDVTIHGCNNSIEYVYGGGNASDVAGTNVVIWGGTIGNAFGGGNGFGASNPGANITDDGTQLYIHGGNILYTYGGSNQKGYINSTITVEVDNVPESGNDPFCNKAYGTCPTTIEELYGGGNEATATTSISQFIQPDVQIKSCDVRIANLYGGARKANHNTDINLTVEGGIFQNVFGGNNISGIIGGDINLTLKGGTMVNAFGGNNAGGDVSGKISVIVEADGGCPLNVDNVYGGGNMAPYTPTTTTLRPEVTIKNGTVNNAVFGGGLGSGAEVTANPLVIVGDNTTGYKAIVGGTKIDGTPGDGHVFGGGNAATVNGNTEVRILHKAKVLGNIYGGGNQGEVGGNTKVVVNGD